MVNQHCKQCKHTHTKILSSTHLSLRSLTTDIDQQELLATIVNLHLYDTGRLSSTVQNIFQVRFKVRWVNVVQVLQKVHGTIRYVELALDPLIELTSHIIIVPQCLHNVGPLLIIHLNRRQHQCVVVLDQFNDLSSVLLVLW